MEKSEDLFSAAAASLATAFAGRVSKHSASRRRLTGTWRAVARQKVPHGPVPDAVSNPRIERNLAAVSTDWIEAFAPTLSSMEREVGSNHAADKRGRHGRSYRSKQSYSSAWGGTPADRLAGLPIDGSVPEARCSQFAKPCKSLDSGSTQDPASEAPGSRSSCKQHRSWQ